MTRKPLPMAEAKRVVRAALREDLGRGDITTRAVVRRDARAEAVVIAKEKGVVAGLPLAGLSFRMLSGKVRFTPLVREGAKVKAGKLVARIEGPLAPILTGERVFLNILSRLSGIATMARAFVDRAGRRVKVLDTRKTTPLLRALEKYAVAAGGGANHRMTLGEAFLIKDNHIAAAGSLALAVRSARRSGRRMPVEVEAESLAQVREAISARADTILLDNMGLGMLKKAIRMARGKAKLEVSGGVTLNNIRRIAALRPDFISVGALTHSAPALDFSLEVVSRR